MKKLKNLFCVIGLLFSMASAGQCVKCNSFEEAKKDPLRVKSIIVNPYTTDILLEEFPSDIGPFENCETLFLVGHNFTSISPDIWKLGTIKKKKIGECNN